MGGAIQEEPEAEEEATSTRASTPAQSRAPTPIVTDTRPDPEPTPGLAPNYASPTVPNYATPTVPTYSSPDAGPSTPLARTQPDSLTRMEAHPDATPSDEPAYDGPGSGDGLPPAYRGGGLSEVARGKRPAHVAESIHEDQPRERDERRVWTDLDAYAFGQGGMQGRVTAHVATDDKRVLERLHLMRGAPQEQREEEAVQAPREEDVFGECSTPGLSSLAAGSGLASSTTGTDVCALAMLASSGGAPLPPPPTKTGTGPVARYGEADLCLPRYLDGEGVLGGVEVEVEVEGMVPSEPPCEGEGVVPSAPPCEAMVLPSAPPCQEEMVSPSAPPCQEEMVLPSAPSLGDRGPLGPCAPPLNDYSTSVNGHTSPSAPPMDDHVPSALALDDHSAPLASTRGGHYAPSALALDDHSSAPLHNDHPDDKAHPHPVLSWRRLNSSSPLLSDEQ
ncbi:hypothetical protein FRC11_001042 [Ceratobasidium sp. 423]|nr:hypothetical protein FRC11_001042 [Ceratobasidium sp. 423]